MSVQIELYKGIANSPNLTLGLFRKVEIRHRRLIGDGTLVALRHTDGKWRQPTAISEAFLAARVSVAGRGDGTLRFAQGWKPGSDFERPVREVRLEGDELYLGTQGNSFARTVDDARIWETRAEGLAFEMATVAA